jgi:hypothetical protein
MKTTEKTFSLKFWHTALKGFAIPDLISSPRPYCSILLFCRWLFGNECCKFFAFLLQFLGMSQVAAITILAVERAMVTHHSGEY